MLASANHVPRRYGHGCDDIDISRTTCLAADVTVLGIPYVIKRLILNSIVLLYLEHGTAQRSSVSS